jgi:hypothetical protein
MVSLVKHKNLVKRWIRHPSAQHRAASRALNGARCPVPRTEWWRAPERGRGVGKQAGTTQRPGRLRARPLVLTGATRGERRSTRGAQDQQEMRAPRSPYTIVRSPARARPCLERDHLPHGGTPEAQVAAGAAAASVAHVCGRYHSRVPLSRVLAARRLFQRV